MEPLDHRLCVQLNRCLSEADSESPASVLLKRRSPELVGQPFSLWQNGSLLIT